MPNKRKKYGERKAKGAGRRESERYKTRGARKLSRKFESFKLA